MIQGKLKKVNTVQGGNTQGENNLHSAMWRSGRRRQEESGARILTMGWDRMANAACVSPNTAKVNCRALIRKLAMEVVAGPIPNRRIGTTYRVFSFKQILERRRKAGLTHVVTRRGGAVELVRPSDVIPAKSLYVAEVDGECLAEADREIPSKSCYAFKKEKAKGSRAPGILLDEAAGSLPDATATCLPSSFDNDAAYPAAPESARGGAVCAEVPNYPDPDCIPDCLPFNYEVYDED